MVVVRFTTIRKNTIQDIKFNKLNLMSSVKLK